MAYPAFAGVLQVLIVTFFLLLRAQAQEVEDEREFQYDGPLGPRNWGNIRHDWHACSSGKLQSPIDLAKDRARLYPSMGLLRRHYISSNASIVNRGHDIMITWRKGSGWIIIQGTNFTLQQLHWHSPSEHSVNGKRYAMEAHLVHMTPDNKKIAVIAILYKFGKADSFLKKQEPEILKLAKKEEAAARSNTTLKHHPGMAAGMINPMHMKFGTNKYYRYLGSLTVPPCTEGVIWSIIPKIRTVSKKQVKLLRRAVADGFERNARPIQPINGRSIRKFKPRPPRD